MKGAVGTSLLTCFVTVVLSTALVDDQASLEELQEARRLFAFCHQNLEHNQDNQDTLVETVLSFKRCRTV